MSNTHQLPKGTGESRTTIIVLVSQSHIRSSLSGPQPSCPADVCTIPLDIVRKTVRTQPESDFLYFLGTLFDANTVAKIVEEYSIGETKGHDAIFY